MANGGGRVQQFLPSFTGSEEEGRSHWAPRACGGAAREVGLCYDLRRDPRAPRMDAQGSGFVDFDGAGGGRGGGNHRNRRVGMYTVVVLLRRNQIHMPNRRVRTKEYRVL